MAQPDEIEAQNCLRRVRENRDEAAFAKLYDVYSAILYRICVLILKDESEAQDALQDIFLQVWERSAGFDPNKGKLYTWLCLLTRCKAIDRIRKIHRANKRVSLTPEGDLEQAQGAAPPSHPSENALDKVVGTQQRECVLHLLEQLPISQAQVISLAFYQGLSQSEIAERTGRPLGTVKTQMRSALQKLAALANPEMKAWL